MMQCKYKVQAQDSYGMKINEELNPWTRKKYSMCIIPYIGHFFQILLTAWLLSFNIIRAEQVKWIETRFMNSMASLSTCSPHLYTFGGTECTRWIL